MCVYSYFFLHIYLEKRLQFQQTIDSITKPHVHYRLITFPIFLIFFINHSKYNKTHYFASKGVSSQSFGFSRSHVWT